MRTVAFAILAITLLVGGAYSQQQNWEYSEHENPIDGKFQIQSTLSIDPAPPRDAILVLSNKGGAIRFLYIAVPKNQMCAFADGDELPAKAAFDGDVHDMMVNIVDFIPDGHSVGVHFIDDNRWIDLIHESDNLYFRLYQNCGRHIDYEFDVSGPVTIPDPS